MRLAAVGPEHVLICHRGIVPDMRVVEGRDVDYASLRGQHLESEVPVVWVESNHPSYILYTSGTTGNPKGVQRNTGGHATALAASMKYVYAAQPGETMFATSDIGWAVGHSYTVYGPLIHGMTTILYEGVPTRPDPAIWWKIVAENRVTTMFSSPTAIRLLKRQDPRYAHLHDMSSLRYLFLAGEPLDVPTAQWIHEALGVPVLDHYWQTETGWPVLSYLPGIEMLPVKHGSPGFAVYGFDLRLVDELTGADVEQGKRGSLVAVPPLPPGCLTTVWGDDRRFVEEYFSRYREPWYSTFDWATRDEDGYWFILGRSDDVINVAGHRLATREIEEVVNGHVNVAAAMVVGVHDATKGQCVLAFVVPRHLGDGQTDAALEREVSERVDQQVGRIARPKKVHVVGALPQTRSGKLLRRAVQAIAEGRDPGDLSTLEDPVALEGIRRAVAAAPGGG